MNDRHLSLLQLLDVAALFLAGTLAYLLRAGDLELDLPYLAVIGAAALMAPRIFNGASVYLPSPLEDTATARRLFAGLTTLTLIILGIGFLTKTSDHFSRLWAVSWFAFALLFTLGARLLLKRRRSPLPRNNRLVLVGLAEDLTPMAAHFADAKDGYALQGLFSPEALPAPPQGIHAGPLADLPRWARTHQPDDILLLPPHGRMDARLQQWISQLRAVPANLHIGPLPFMGAESSIHPGQIGGIHLLTVAERPLTILDRLVKSLLDWLLALLLLLAASPVMILCALAIRLEGPGPLLFCQKRLGLGNREITVYKFRTMHPGPEDKTAPQAQPNDPRITRVGRFLRRFSLDELPQLFNVLNGSMALVGPRPHAVTHNETYAALIDLYLARHRVKPGITGLAQVKGLRGPTDTLEKMQRRLEHDLHYIDNWSPWLDFFILLATIRIVISGENAH